MLIFFNWLKHSKKISGSLAFVLCNPLLIKQTGYVNVHFCTLLIKTLKYALKFPSIEENLRNLYSLRRVRSIFSIFHLTIFFKENYIWSIYFTNTTMSKKYNKINICLYILHIANTSQIIFLNIVSSYKKYLSRLGIISMPLPEEKICNKYFLLFCCLPILVYSLTFSNRSPLFRFSVCLFICLFYCIRYILFFSLRRCLMERPGPQ